MNLSEYLTPELLAKVEPKLSENMIRSIADLYVAIVYDGLTFDLTFAQRRRLVEDIVRPIRLQLELTDDIRTRLQQRTDRKLPEFHRQEWFRYQKLGDAWRKPRGIHSKLRRKLGYRPPTVSIGYRTDRLVRELHPSGYRLRMIANPQELRSIDRRYEAAVIRGSVGDRKRRIIEHDAITNRVYIINRRMFRSMESVR